MTRGDKQPTGRKPQPGDSADAGQRSGGPRGQRSDDQAKSPDGGQESSEHRHMSDERGEHHYPEADTTDAERRARQEREDVKRRLEHDDQSELRRSIKRNKP